MKFVCLKCETYMTFQKVEKPAEGSLGVFFTCPSCNAQFSMVTNPGETQMVHALGVQLGGRATAEEPFELTRGSLKEEARPASIQMAAYLNERIQAGQPVGSKAVAPSGVTTSGEKTGGCPFSAMVAQMGLTASDMKATTGSNVVWSAEAKARLEQLPAFVQPMVKTSVEAYARKHGLTTITLQVMDDSKHASNDLVWTKEAEQRLENIPDFIRPMARREIERIAKERGLTTVTVQVMDEAKARFMKFL
jgi:hypothetical protein